LTCAFSAGFLLFVCNLMYPVISTRRFLVSSSISSREHANRRLPYVLYRTGTERILSTNDSDGLRIRLRKPSNTLTVLRNMCVIFGQGSLQGAARRTKATTQRQCFSSVATQ